MAETLLGATTTREDMLDRAVQAAFDYLEANGREMQHLALQNGRLTFDGDVDARGLILSIVASLRSPSDDVIDVGAANVSPWYSPAAQRGGFYGDALNAAASAWDGMIDQLVDGEDE